MDLRCILILNLRGGSGRVYRYCYIRQLLTEIPPVLEEKNVENPVELVKVSRRYAKKSMV